MDVQYVQGMNKSVLVAMAMTGAGVVSYCQNVMVECVTDWKQVLEI